MWLAPITTKTKTKIKIVIIILTQILSITSSPLTPSYTVPKIVKENFKKINFMTNL